MVIGSYISIITLNVNGFNAPTKRGKLTGWIQKQHTHTHTHTHTYIYIYIYIVYKRPTSYLQTLTD